MLIKHPLYRTSLQLATLLLNGIVSVMPAMADTPVMTPPHANAIEGGNFTIECSVNTPIQMEQMNLLLYLPYNRIAYGEYAIEQETDWAVELNSTPTFLNATFSHVTNPENVYVSCRYGGSETQHVPIRIQSLLDSPELSLYEQKLRITNLVLPESERSTRNDQAENSPDAAYAITLSWVHPESQPDSQGEYFDRKYEALMRIESDCSNNCQYSFLTYDNLLDLTSTLNENFPDDGAQKCTKGNVRITAINEAGRGAGAEVDFELEKPSFDPKLIQANLNDDNETSWFIPVAQAHQLNLTQAVFSNSTSQVIVNIQNMTDNGFIISHPSLNARVPYNLSIQSDTPSQFLVSDGIRLCSDNSEENSEDNSEVDQYTPENTANTTLLQSGGRAGWFDASVLLPVLAAALYLTR